jgi:hypothetical protein
VHSCCGHDDRFNIDECNCRLIVSTKEAERMIQQHEAVNLDHRAVREYDGHGQIIAVKEFKSPPISSLGNRIAIQRGAERKAHVSEDDIVRMRAIVVEDLQWRRAERDCKTDVEHAIALETQAELIVEVDPDTFDKKRDESWGRPGIFATEERSLGSIGRDVGLSTFDESIDNLDDQDCQPSPPEKDAEPVEGCEGEEAVEPEAGDNEAFEQAA